MEVVDVDAVVEDVEADEEAVVEDEEEPLSLAMAAASAAWVSKPRSASSSSSVSRWYAFSLGCLRGRRLRSSLHRESSSGAHFSGAVGDAVNSS